MNKRILFTVTTYIVVSLGLIIAIAYSSSAANSLIRNKVAEKQFNDSHILELKSELLNSQMLINNSKDNEVIRLGPRFHAIKSTTISNDLASGYSTVNSKVTFYYAGTENSVGQLLNSSSFYRRNNQVSIVDISSNNNYLGAWDVQHTGTGPANKSNASITSSVLFSASIPDMPSEDFEVTSTISFSTTGSVITNWQADDNQKSKSNY